MSIPWHLYTHALLKELGVDKAMEKASQELGKAMKKGSQKLGEKIKTAMRERKKVGIFPRYAIECEKCHCKCCWCDDGEEYEVEPRGLWKTETCKKCGHADRFHYLAEKLYDWDSKKLVSLGRRWDSEEMWKLLQQDEDPLGFELRELVYLRGVAYPGYKSLSIMNLAKT